MNVTDSSLKPLQSYFKEHKQAANRLAYNLRHNRDSGEIQLVESGRYFLFFPNTRCVCKSIVRRLRPTTLVQLWWLTTKLWSNGRWQPELLPRFRHGFPGRYHISVKSTVNGRKLDADSIVNIWSNKTVDMNIKTATFQIRSVPNGVIYVNDRKVGKLNKYGNYTFKDYPIAKRMEIYIQSTVNGKKIKSETVRDLSQSISSEFSDSEDDVTDYDNTADTYQGNSEKDVYQDEEGDYIVNPIWPGLIQAGDAARMLYNNFKEPDAEAFEMVKIMPTTRRLLSKLRLGRRKES